MQSNSRVSITCKQCRKDFSVNRYRFERYNVQFCSMECKALGKSVEFVCEWCKKTSRKMRCHAEMRRFCSRKCAIAERASVPADVRFFAYVGIITPTGCILWKGAKDNLGYGKIKVGDKLMLTHRYSYELLVGPIPDGLDLCHKCDTPGCLNPAHLFPGTRKQNMEDAVSKGRMARGERHGHSKLTAKIVKEIRQRYAAGGIFMKDIAKNYGIGEGCVWKIVNRTTWRHID